VRRRRKRRKRRRKRNPLVDFPGELYLRLKISTRGRKKKKE